MVALTIVHCQDKRSFDASCARLLFLLFLHLIFLSLWFKLIRTTVVFLTRKFLQIIPSKRTIRPVSDTSIHSECGRWTFYRAISLRSHHSLCFPVKNNKDGRVIAAGSRDKVSLVCIQGYSR